ncbi:MAG: alpha/beta hydrolase family protein [Bdellovibrionota bacterium]
MKKFARAVQMHWRLYRHLSGIRHCVFTAVSGRDESYFFDQGWGNETQLKLLSDKALTLLPPAPIEILWDSATSDSNGTHRSGRFESPLPAHLIHSEARKAWIELHLPHDANYETPLCVVFAMTGDEGFEYRFRTLSQQLLRIGIGTLLLENSYYGQRKPKAQRDFRLQTVSEMLSMSVASVMEGKALLKHLRDLGYKNLGVAGVSQGGMVAALVGAQSEFPVAIASSLAAHAPDEVLARGLLSCFVEWNALKSADGIDAKDRLRDLFKVGDVTEFAAPQAPRAAYLLGAKKDAVIPRDSIARIHDHWPGSQLRWIPGTHVTSIFAHSRAFRRLIRDAFGALSKEPDLK